MDSGLSTALSAILIISVAYLTIDYFVGRYRARRRQRFLDMIASANTIDELLAVRSQALGSRDMIAMIDRKLDKIAR